MDKKSKHQRALINHNPAFTSCVYAFFLYFLLYFLKGFKCHCDEEAKIEFDRRIRRLLTPTFDYKKSIQLQKVWGKESFMQQKYKRLNHSWCKAVGTDFLLLGVAYFVQRIDRESKIVIKLL